MTARVQGLRSLHPVRTTRRGVINMLILIVTIIVIIAIVSFRN